MGTKRSREDSVGVDAEAEEEAQTTYVSVELVDFADYPILDKHESLEIEGLETAQPILRIGEFTLYGVYEDAVGTDIFYDIKGTDKTPEGATLHHVTKRLKFTISPKDKEHFEKKTVKVV
ncbi:hypothetical protein ACHHYP_02240 [Achlya hypogyna]|uniref:Transcription factor TFIIIC triple barrel domain-containing protein n=1 Tax=Achlya hypogyna TaxID=1202772 RepID=A0A1V9ZS91_ACHHY|nr:hypothetical protein ACHHYP_02240 [Achlya hypogyna]